MVLSGLSCSFTAIMLRSLNLVPESVPKNPDINKIKIDPKSYNQI